MEQRARLNRPAPRPVLSGGAAAARTADQAARSGTTRPASRATMNRTKIVATIGPASRTPQVLRQLIEAGVDVFRLNFSHGTHEEHSAVARATSARSADEMGRHVAVLAGPVRARRSGSGRSPATLVECRLGDEFTPRRRPAVGRPPRADLHVPRAARRPQARRDGAVRRRHGGDERDRRRRRAGPG